jgi:endoglucanase
MTADDISVCDSFGDYKPPLQSGKNMGLLKNSSVILFCLVGAVGCETGNTRSAGEIRALPPILKESWNAYVQRFIQQDGRVIDHSAGAISTSEGQAYAMLRAVWIGDRDNFDKTFNWAVNNLNSGIRMDHLWAWKWGKDAKGKWTVLDKAFASDADQDAALALILASRVWHEEKYANHARAILRDLWALGTIQAGGRRYLLAGDSLCSGAFCRINPSYYAPYAYRVFADFDRTQNWGDLIDTSYYLLAAVSGLAATGLPSDWVQLNVSNGAITRASEKDGSFSYDAFRVYWRIELDRELFQEPKADQFLHESLRWISAEWEKNHRLPAVISPAGKPLVEYESLEILSVLMCVLHNEAMHKKLAATYSQGIWSNRNSYYLQNWAWFGTAVYSGYLGPLAILSEKK